MLYCLLIPLGVAAATAIGSALHDNAKLANYTASSTHVERPRDVRKRKVLLDGWLELPTLNITAEHTDCGRIL